jgi:hypothetical protein
MNPLRTPFKEVRENNQETSSPLKKLSGSRKSRVSPGKSEVSSPGIAGSRRRSPKKFREDKENAGVIKLHEFRE